MRKLWYIIIITTPDSPSFAINGTVLKESDDLDILERLQVTFEGKMNFEK